MPNLFQKIFPLEHIILTVRRFALSVICALGMFTIWVSGLHNLWNLNEHQELLNRLAVLMICGYFWFGAAKVFAESRDWPSIKYLALSLVVFAGVAALILTSAQWALHAAFIVPALFLLVLIAPYINHNRTDDLSFWVYNKNIGLGAVLAIVAGIVLGGGLCAAFLSIEYLFGVKMGEEFYGDIWSFAAFIFTPVYTLSWVPKSFNFEDEDCKEPPGLVFILNWIFAPLVLIYLVILYAYFAKILIMWELPKGQLASLITGFAAVGIMAYLIAWPLKDRPRAAPQLKLVCRIFFPALIIPVAMQALSIYERVSEYGMTEQRYMIILAAIWLAVITALFMLRRLPLKVIPAVIAFLLVITSFGPWGGVALSGYSQQSRLMALLNQYGILQDGQIAKAPQEVSFADRINISSIVDYLRETNRQAFLMKLTTQEKLEAENFHDDRDQSCSTKSWDYSCKNFYVALMGFEFTSPGQTEERMNHFNLSPYIEEKFMDLRAYDYAFYYNDATLPLEIINHNPELDQDLSAKEWKEFAQTQENDFEPKIEMRFENNTLTITPENGAPLSFDLLAFARGHMIDEVDFSKPYFLKGENEDINALVEIQQLTGSRNENNIFITGVKFNLYIKLK